MESNVSRVRGRDLELEEEEKFFKNVGNADAGKLLEILTGECEHDWTVTGCDPENGREFFECKKCGKLEDVYMI